MKPSFRETASWLWQFARRHRAGLMISAGVCVLSLGLYVPVYVTTPRSPFFIILRDLELKTLDMRFRLRGKRPPSAPIVIVTIDQKSQDVLGRWPFSRSFFAQAVDVLKDAGAKVVAFDITFPQPDENSALKSLRQIRKDYDDAAGRSSDGSSPFATKLKTLETNADSDQQFSDALSRFDNAILGYYFFFDKNEAASQKPELVNPFVNFLSFQAYPQVMNPEFGKEKFKCEYCEALGLEPNIEPLAKNAKNFGFFNVVPDSDGVVRREPVIIGYPKDEYPKEPHSKEPTQYYPSLDVATVLAYTNRPLDQVAVFFNRNGLERIDFGPFAIPTDPEGFVQIDFHGGRNTYDWYSLSDVVAGKLPEGKSLKQVFGDKIVLIGPTATGIGDNRSTPFEAGETFPGVEVHANFIDNLLTNQFIRRGLRENLIDIGFILLFSLAAGVLLSVVPAARATPIVLILLGLFLWLAYYLFAAYRIWIAVFMPTATLALNYGAIVSYRFLFEEREKKRVRSAFGQYVAPGIVKLLMDRPELMQLGGEEKVLTALFSDIRGFTAISEGLTAGALVELLNEYLTDMTDIIFKNWGTLDKYIGDAIMAYWGAPYPQADHPERACRAALEMLEALKKLQQRWEAQGRAQINIGVGINTGPMVFGNMGSKNRKNITIMGDNVNLASRLEGINKEFGTRLIISESTFLAAGHDLVTRELDLIRVKGKMKPVRIYELLAHGDQKEKYRDLLDRFQRGLNGYRGGEWETALGIFERLVRDYPNDKPSQVFLDRCQSLMGRPPVGAWDGVYTMTHK